MGSRTIYIAHINPSLNDGGVSRNLAFYSHFQDKNATVVNVWRTRKMNRVFNSVRMLFFLYFTRKSTIFIHQGTLIYLFPISVLRSTLVMGAIKRVLQKVAYSNKLIIEINDLPYEQSIDLELPVYDAFKHLEDALYTLKNCFFIFAANEMSNYVAKKYGIRSEYVEVVINGGSALDEAPLNVSYDGLFHSNRKKFVYAGTLNKGRQIEDLIFMFEKMPNFDLILLGAWGEWISAESLPQNVIYLGNHDNFNAQLIVSKCDIGLIQYDSSKFYYNICFPTKISFYITSGIPVLSTRLKELVNEFKGKDNVYFKDFDKWPEFLNTVSDEIIEAGKVESRRSGKNYEWKNLLSKSQLLNI